VARGDWTIVRSVLAKASAPVLARFATANTLLAFDYDGTLAPLVAKPAAARMRAPTRALLARLSHIYPCAIVTGRARVDLAPLIRGLDGLTVVANHGGDLHGGSAVFERQARHWLAQLSPRLQGWDGVVVENKKLGVAIHYRAARHPQRALAAIREAVADLANARLISGKTVIDVVPTNAPNKGSALEHIRAEQGCDAALYVGDDETDEDVFSLATSAPLLTIRVGRKPASKAAFYLHGQLDIDDLLERLVALRGAATTSPW